MRIPEITDVERLSLKPGDALVIKMDTDKVEDAAADLVAARVREALKLPSLAVFVINRNMDMTVISPEGMPQDHPAWPDQPPGQEAGGEATT